MHEVSGVTGAGPILHGVFDHLHAQKGTTWYRRPAAIVERNIHPLTGKLLADGDQRGVREKFVPENLPVAERADEYDSVHRVKLPSEYNDWFASAENGLRDRAVLANSREELHITAPLAGALI